MLTVNPSPGTMLLPVVHNDSRDARLITELSVNRMAVLNKAVPRNSMCLYKPGVLPNNDVDPIKHIYLVHRVSRLG